MNVRSVRLLAGIVLLVLGMVVQPAAAHHRPDHAGGPPPFVDLPDRGGPGDDGEVAAARVVVAAIDTAFNPYHEFFHVGGDGPYVDGAAPTAVTPEVLAEFGIGHDQIISVTRTGDMEADLAADADQWAAVEAGTPYWFEGTNVIGISFAGSPPLQPTPSKSAHGVSVSAAVLEANPDAVVVLVEGTTTEAEEWAFTHPAVDAVTTSYGPVGSPPLPFHLDFSFTGVVTNGKLHFGAVDNTPGLSPIDTTGGPWWSIGVAGFQEEVARGRQLVSGTAADFVANFTQSLPSCTDCQSGREVVSGTSFASPRSAGTTSLGILAARQAAGHEGGIVDGDERPLMVATDTLSLTNWQVRRALEEAAAYPSASEWSPSDEQSVWNLTSAPIVDPAPWSTAGWGLITNDPDREVVSEMLAHLGVGGEPTRTKSAEACASMTAQLEFRRFYWDHYAVAGESWMTDEDPYIRC